MASNDCGACLRFFFVFVTHNSTHATDTAEQIKPDAVRTRRLRGRGERRRKEESVIYRFVRGPRRARRSGPSHKTRVLGGKVCVMTGDHEGRELPEYRNFSLSLSVCRGSLVSRLTERADDYGERNFSATLVSTLSLAGQREREIS